MHMHLPMHIICRRDMCAQAGMHLHMKMRLGCACVAMAYRHGTGLFVRICARTFAFQDLHDTLNLLMLVRLYLVLRWMRYRSNLYAYPTPHRTVPRPPAPPHTISPASQQLRDGSITMCILLCTPYIGRTDGWTHGHVHEQACRHPICREALLSGRAGTHVGACGGHTGEIMRTTHASCAHADTTTRAVLRAQ